MQQTRLLVLLVAAVAVASLAGVDAAALAKLVNKDVHRSIDFTSCIVRYSTEITVDNVGSSAASEYILCVPKSAAINQALLEVQEESTPLRVTRTTIDGANSECEYYSARLSKPLAGGASVELTVTQAFTHVQRAFPVEITQSQRQQMVAEIGVYVVSPYETKVQKTIVTFPSAAVVSHDVVKPTALAGTTLTYGPYKAVSAHTFKTAKLHFENNAPFLAVTSLVKELEVSHWGSNLAVEETFALKHDGAKLKGGFSRFDYQRNPAAAGAASVRSVMITLPRDAADVYYRDTIGNVSTSALRYTDEAAEMEMRPRFPLFGGWKTEFYMGYNLPLGKSLVVLPSGKYQLTADLAASLEEVPMDAVEVRVILPEGADDVVLRVPFEAQPAVSLSSRKTYLDTVGRPVVAFKLANLVPEQNLSFQLEYSLASSALWREPALLIMAYAVLFALAIAYQRVDLTLAPSAPAGDNLLRLASVAGNVTDEMGLVDGAIDAFKSSQNKAELGRVRDGAGAAIKSLLDTDFAALAEAIVATQPSAESVIRELRRELESALAAQRKLVTVYLKLATGELTGDALDKALTQEESAYKAALAAVDRIRSALEH